MTTLKPLTPDHQSGIRNQLERMTDRPQILNAHWCIPPEDGPLLQLLVQIHQSTRVLEIGTSIGYSTLWFALGLCATGGTLITIDASEERQTQAKTAAEAAGISPSIQFLQGDAITHLKALITAQSQFDCIFLDARKSEYLDYAKLSEQLLLPGGLLIADNTLSHRAQVEAFISYMDTAAPWSAAEIPTKNGLVVAQYAVV